jgi:hypothetical protein
MLTPDKGDPYKELDKGGEYERCPYRNKTPHFKFPFGIYNCPSGVEAKLHYLKNGARRALVLGGITDEIRKDPKSMLRIMFSAPEAILHVDPSIFTKEFVIDALKANPYAYELLPKEMQKDTDITNAYAHGMMTYYGEVIPITERTPWGMDTGIEEASVFLHAVSKHCDLSVFYSVENYKKAYQMMIVNGTNEYIEVTRDRHDATYKERYTMAACFVHMARKAFKDDPLMLAKYQMAEAEVVEKNLEHCAQRASGDAEYYKDSRYAEAVAAAARTLEHPPAILNIPPRSGQHMIDAVLGKERESYEKYGDQIRKRIAECKKWPKGSRSDVDYCVRDAMKNPLIGLSKEEISEWWGMRGEDLAKYREARGLGLCHHSSDMARLQNWSKDIPELRVGEQLTIDGFDAPSHGNR